MKPVLNLENSCGVLFFIALYVFGSTLNNIGNRLLLCDIEALVLWTVLIPWIHIP